MPSMASAGLVPLPTKPSSFQSSSSSLSPGPAEGPPGQQTPTGQDRVSGAGRLEGLRHRFSSEGISVNTADILLSAQRASTRTQYKSCWAKWDRWCGPRQIDPFRPSVKDVLHFLTELFDQGKQYSTINTYRSAISSTVPHVEGATVGQHSLICKLMNRVFNKRPPEPRYSQTWDVSRVTKLFENWSDNSNLELKHLARKCAMLLALTGAKRQSDLHAIDLTYMRSLPEGVEFKIPGLTKTRVPGKDVVFFFQLFRINLNYVLFDVYKNT